MSLSIAITAGKTLARNERANNAKLNALGLPTMALSGTASTAQLGDNTVTAIKGAYGPWFYCTDGGSANAHSLTAAASGTTLPTTLVAGQEFAYTAAATNTGAVTVTIGSAGTKALTKNGTTAMTAGEVRAGMLVWVRYDGTQFQLAVPIGQPRLDRFATTGGTTTAYTATFSPTLTALTNGTRVLVKWNATNTSTATFSPDGLTAKAITKGGDVALVAGDIVANQISELVYDSAAQAAVGAWLLASPVTVATRNTVPVRQTVLGCSCDTTGIPNYLTGIGTGALSYQNTSTTTPVAIAFAAGHDSSGSADYVGYVSSNSAAWTGLTTNGTYYLYAARDATTGAITYGQTTLQPTYTNSGTASVTNGQHTYLINEGKMYLGSGAASSAVQRVFMGECVVAANVVSTLTLYMPRGEFKSPADQAIAANNTDQAWTETHRLGAAPRDFRWVLVNTSADLGYAVNDEVPVNGINADTGGYKYALTTYSNATTLALRIPLGTLAYVAALVNAGAYTSNAGITAANWKLRAYAWRGW